MYIRCFPAGYRLPGMGTLGKLIEVFLSEDKDRIRRNAMFKKLFCLVAFAAILYVPSTGLADFTPVLGTAQDFAVLAYSGITNTGSTTITGDVGSHPTGTVTGQADITLLTGAYHLADDVANTAKTDLSTAYTALNNMTPTQTLLTNQLGGRTLTSGVYAFQGGPDPILLDGILTLDAEGNNNAYWVFQIPAALITGNSSSVVFEDFGSNGGSDNGLFWTVGSSAGIFGSTSFQGNILAYASINLYNSATIMHGRALAQNGTVTMDTNTISFLCYNGGPGLSGGLTYDENGDVVPVPVPGALLLACSGMGSALAFGRRFFSVS